MIAESTFDSAKAGPPPLPARYNHRMSLYPQNQPRWYELALYTLGGIVVGLSLAVILWL